MDEAKRAMGELMGPEVVCRVSNAQTWTNVALTNKDTCINGFNGISFSPMKAEVASRYWLALYVPPSSGVTVDMGVYPSL